MNVHTLAMNFNHANLECSISIVFACFRQVSSKSDSILGVAFLESQPITVAQSRALKKRNGTFRSQARMAEFKEKFKKQKPTQVQNRDGPSM